MPVKRAFASIPVKIGDGGRLLPDLARGTIGAANFTEKVNFVSGIGEVFKRAGWDYPAPMDDWAGVDLDAFGVPIEAIRGVRRPNGTYAIVACGSSFIKAYDYDTGWVTIGSGYSTQFDAGFRYWQIEDIAGYALFNNGRDLPAVWQIGDAAVTPLYEFREAGYASAGGMVEYVDGVLMFHDILEIADSAQSAAMNSDDPYGTLDGTEENILTYSQDFTNAAWVKTNLTATDGFADPLGGMTADRVVETAVNGLHTTNNATVAMAMVAGEQFTWSLFIGQSSTRYAGRLSFTAGTESALVSFDLNTGVVALVSHSGLTGIGVGIEFKGTFGGVDWWRVWVSATKSFTQTSTFGFQVIYGNGSSFSYLGDITKGFDLWGAQINRGSHLKPYVPTTSAASTIDLTRITFRRVWSNIGDPRDFAVTVPGSVDAYSSPTELTLAWPMASFQAGDAIEIIGAGTSAGNLITTIAAIDGTTITLTDPALTTVVDADVERPTDIDSIAGYDDIEDDGSAIVCQIALKTQLMTFKASGHIWQTYYTGDVDTPFAKDRVTKKAGVAPRFPRAVVNIVNDNNEEYLLFPGAKHFYRLDLGSQAPQQEPLFMGAEKELFFSRLATIGTYDVWAVDNVCTDEIFFAYLWQAYEIGYYGANRAIALKYAKHCESIAEVSAFNFTCAASVQKPLADNTCDEIETWFLMGDGDGFVTLYGETNKGILTRSRYGETFEASLEGGFFAVGGGDNGTYARRFSLDPSNPDASAATSVSIYGARSPNADAQLLETRTLTDPDFPGAMGLYYRKPYFTYRLVSDTDDELRISGFIWRMAGVETQAIDRLN